MSEENPQVIHLPTEEKGEVKFVQLVIDGEPVIAFAEWGGEFHSEIMTRILTSREIDFGVDGFNNPLPEGDMYELVGAGKSTRKGETLCLYGDSHDYHIRPNQDHIDSLRPQLPSGLEIKFKAPPGSGW